MEIVPRPDPQNQIQVFKYNGIEFPVVIKNDEPWWYAAPVCEALDIEDVSRAVSRLDDDEKSLAISTRNGVPVRHLLVNEAGLYSLILGSRKPEAKAFKRWITHEVLPAIRKTGAYITPSAPRDEFQILEQMMAVFAQTRREVQELRELQGSQAISIEAINARIDNAEYYTVEAYCNVQGIKTTLSIRQKWGKEAAAYSRAQGIQIREIPTPEKPWPTEKLYHQSVLLIVCVPTPKRLPGQLPLELA